MPNWCSNTLTITGKKEDLDRFKKQAEVLTEQDQTCLSFGKFVPCPKELEDTTSGFKGEGTPEQAELEAQHKANTEKFGYPTWYEWRIANWGTKWEACEPTIYEGEGVIRYAFDTAWSPPTEWLYKVAPQFPELRFKLVYREDGMTFMGALELEGGDVLNDEQIDTDSVWQDVNSEGLDPDSDEYMERVEELLDEMENNL